MLPPRAPAPSPRAPRARPLALAIALALPLAPARAAEPADDDPPPPPALARVPALELRSDASLTLSPAHFLLLPLARPDGPSGAFRGFEAATRLVPGARAEPFGVGFVGASSPENRYRVDGLTASDPALGVLGARLPVDLLREVRVTTAGFLPEHGRVDAALVEAETRSGDGAGRGAAFASVSPGAFAPTRALAPRLDAPFATATDLAAIEDVGASISGPIWRRRLYGHAGLVGSIARLRVRRAVTRRRLDPATGEALDDGGLVAARSGHPPAIDVATDTEKAVPATERAIAWAGRLDAIPSRDHRLTLSVFGVATSAGGGGELAIDPLRGGPDVGAHAGTLSAIATRRPTLASGVVARWLGAFGGSRRAADVLVGWYRGRRATLPSDGSALGSTDGLAGAPQVIWRRRPARGLDELDRSAAGACARVRGATPCPAPELRTGGPGYLEEVTVDRFEARAKLSAIAELLGHHELAVGGDVELARLDHVEAWSGGGVLRESTTGATFTDHRRLGALAGPDDARLPRSIAATSSSWTVGAFAQDRWAIGDVVTLEGGVRWDAQALSGADREVGLALPAMWSPRVGVVVDPTQRGEGRVYAHWARTFESVPLDLADRALPGRGQVASVHAAAGAGGLCDPRTDAGAARCLDAASPRTPSALPGDPSPTFAERGGARLPVDPDLRPPSSDTLLAGVELEVALRARVGVRYERRWLNHALGVMSRDEGKSYFLGNPGEGLASDFREARRDYDAVTVHVARPFEGGWLALASYTASWLRGNWSGLYRPETGQLAPNTTPDFDLRSLQANRDGPLPGDRRHAITIAAARSFDLPARLRVSLGAGWRARSGEPTSVLGAHPIYGADAVYVLPRGAGERLPWVHEVDAHVGLGVDLGGGTRLDVGVDVWNLFDWRAPTAIDQRFTSAAVLPVPSGTAADIPGAPSDRSGGRLRNADGTRFDPRAMNPSFATPIAWQPPRVVRVGARFTW